MITFLSRVTLLFLTTSQLQATSDDLPDGICLLVENVACTAEANPGCKSGQCNGDTCQECKPDEYFRPDNTNDKCLSCGLIENCVFCADLQGCQQCREGDSQPYEPEINSCGIKVCRLNGQPDIETTEPTKNPSVGPSMNPSAWPTASPLTLEELIEEAVGDSWSIGVDPSLLDNEYEACVNHYGCGDIGFLNSFTNICDVEVHTMVELAIQLEDNVHELFKTTICCKSTLRGTFFIRAMLYAEKDPVSGLYVKTVSYFLEGTDVESIDFLREMNLN